MEGLRDRNIVDILADDAEDSNNKAEWPVVTETVNDASSFDAFENTMAEYLLPHFMHWLEKKGDK